MPRGSAPRRRSGIDLKIGVLEPGLIASDASTGSAHSWIAWAPIKIRADA
jgi:hypothetical protein